MSFREKMDIILAEVAERFGVEVEDILGDSREAQYVDPRHVTVYLARQLLSHNEASYSALGRKLDREHTSIMNADQRIHDLLASESPLNSREVELCDKVRCLYAVLDHRLNGAELPPLDEPTSPPPVDPPAPQSPAPSTPREPMSNLDICAYCIFGCMGLALVCLVAEDRESAWILVAAAAVFALLANAVRP